MEEIYKSLSKATILLQLALSNENTTRSKKGLITDALTELAHISYKLRTMRSPE